MTKILYVEDNPDNVYMLTRRLKKKGFELIIAGDGQEGIDKAIDCLLYTSPSPRDAESSRMPSSA